MRPFQLKILKMFNRLDVFTANSISLLSQFFLQKIGSHNNTDYAMINCAMSGKRIIYSLETAGIFQIKRLSN